MLKAVNIARLRHRITIQELVLTADGQGGFVESWSDFATVWASVEPKSSSERFFSQQLQDVYDHEVYVRKMDGIKAEMRFTFRNRVFQIKSIEHVDNERNFFLKLKCQENVGS